MIYTVTFNPSLDYAVCVEQMKTGVTNRTTKERIYPGGKGINISLLLSSLGVKSTALGFVAGFTGDEIVRRLAEAGVQTDFICLQQGMSRINVKVAACEETEINGRGPELDTDAQKALLEKLDKLGQGDVLFLAGSVPGGVSTDIYGQIMERIAGRGVTVVVDAVGKLLLQTLPYRPFLLKPNQYELGELFGQRLTTEEELVYYGKKLQELGARNVLISRGSQGAVLLTEAGRILTRSAPQGTLVSSIGAGDSMAAGFMAEWLAGGDDEAAFLKGLAAGSATAFCEHIAGGKEIEALYHQLTSTLEQHKKSGNL